MSRIINCNVSDNCKPWRAPDLDVSNDDTNFDPNLSSLENIKQRDQQQQLDQQTYEKSYAKGYIEGMQKGQQQIAEQVERLNAVMAKLAMPLTDIDDRVVDELVQLSMAAVKQMVRRELKISPGEVVAVLKEALNLLPVADGDITLELHPDDASLIRKSLINPATNLSWKIIEDPLLTPGGCRIVTNTTRIDATVEKRINAVIAEVMGGERKVDSTL